MPGLWVNLFIINKALKNGFTIGNEDIIIHLSKDSTILSFDRVLKTKNGIVSGVRLNSMSIETSGNVVNSKKYEVKFDINKLHKAIERCGEEALRITAKSYDWKLLAKLETCEDCAFKKQSRKKLINSGYKVAIILDKYLTLTLVPLTVKALKVLSSGL
jgi:hypothetical protein